MNARTDAPEATAVDPTDAVGIVGRWLENAKTTALESAPGYIGKALVFLAILFVFWILARVARRVVSRALSASRLNVSGLLASFFVAAAHRGVMLLGLLIGLSQIGVELGPLLAGLGIAGFVVGFALQDTLSNFAAGMMILLYQPYDVGDAIEAGGVSGKVDRMNLVSTTIRTFDNQVLLVPNSKIWGDVIRNVTAQDTRRVDMTFGIGYEDDIDKAERILGEIVAGHPLSLTDPEPTIRLHNLGDSAIEFIVRPWTQTDAYWDLYWDVTREVKRRFDAEGISIPYPQRDVHLVTHSDAGAPALGG